MSNIPNMCGQCAHWVPRAASSDYGFCGLAFALPDNRPQHYQPFLAPDHVTWPAVTSFSDCEKNTAGEPK